MEGGPSMLSARLVETIKVGFVLFPLPSVNQFVPEHFLSVVGINPRDVRTVGLTDRDEWKLVKPNR